MKLNRVPKRESNVKKCFCNRDRGFQVTSDFKTDVTEAFIRIGLPFWSTIEFHLGYHAMSFTSIDITKSATLLKNYSIDKKSYSGGMTTIGVQVAF